MTQQTFYRYIFALLVTAAAVAFWWATPGLHGSPFVLFIAAVIITARFCGFGPGVFATVLSVAIVEYIIAYPSFGVTLARRNFTQFCLFVLVGILAASIARQKSKAEIRTEQARAQLAAIVESSADAILSKDTKGCITSWNEGAEKLYGYRADEVIGKHISIIAPPEQKQEIDRIMHKLLRGERIDHYLAERVRKDGGRVIVYLSISPLYGSSHEVIGASIIAHDVTLQIRAEEALRKNEKLATAGRLAATIAHEINNPLEAIANLLYLARKDSKKANEYLLMAEKEVQRVAGISQQTLSLVREAASPVKLDVGNVIEEVVRLYIRKANSKQIKIQSEIEPGVEILGLPGELRQVFSNIILNAIEASPEQGRLRVRVERSRDWRNGSDLGARIVVADAGHGIAPETMSHLFEPFYTTKQPSGTGLGLWLSQSIVQKHGGRISVRSRTGLGRSGTVFSIFLPAAVPACVVEELAPFVAVRTSY